MKQIKAKSLTFSRITIEIPPKYNYTLKMAGRGYPTIFRYFIATIIAAMPCNKAARAVPIPEPITAHSAIVSFRVFCDPAGG
jgi:hypothetical protein